MDYKILINIVTFNSQLWIEKVIKSLLNSDILLTILVVDNNSNDQTIEILKEFSEIKLICSNRNLGFGRANNIGIEYSIMEKFDFVFFLNHDAWVESNTISNLVNAYILQENEGVFSPLHLDGTGHSLDFNFERCLVSQFKTRFLTDFFMNKLTNSPYPVGFINAAAWFCSVSLLKEIGGFNTSFFHYGEDNNFGQRLIVRGYNFYLVPSSRIFHDCPQISRRKYIGVKENARRDYPEYLIILLNPKHSLNYNLRETTIKFCIGLIKAIFPLNRSLLGQQFLIFYYLIRDFRKIKINFRIQLNKSAFLSNT
jgi:GT2 family glycosyltransferase